MKERGKNLKESNFSFGSFEDTKSMKTIPTNVYEHARQFHAERAKQNHIAKLRGQELK